jgi:hypothetical protein
MGLQGMMQWWVLGHIILSAVQIQEPKTTEKCLWSPQQQETAEKKPDLYDHIADNATHIIIYDELSSE